MPPRHAGRRRRPRSPERPANDDIDRILEEERVAAARGERVTKKTKIAAVVVGALGVIGAAVLALPTVLPRANEPFALETNLTDAFPNPAQPAYSLVESQVEFYVIEGGKRVYYGGRKEATCPVTNSDWDAPKNIQLLVGTPTMAVPRVEGDALQYLKDEVEARVADLLDVAQECGAMKHIVRPNITPDEVVDIRVFNMGFYEPMGDHDSETFLMNTESQCVQFAQKDLWKMESRLDPENFPPEWAQIVQSRSAWLDKLPLALDVWQGKGSPGVKRQVEILFGAECAEKLQNAQTDVHAAIFKLNASARGQKAVVAGWGMAGFKHVEDMLKQREDAREFVALLDPHVFHPQAMIYMSEVSVEKAQKGENVVGVPTKIGTYLSGNQPVSRRHATVMGGIEWCKTHAATPSSRRRVDGVEVMIQQWRRRAANFDFYTGTYVEASHAVTWIARLCGVGESFNSKVFERTWARDGPVFEEIGKLRKAAAAKLGADRRAGNVPSWNAYVAARRARGWFTAAELEKISAVARGVATAPSTLPSPRRPWTCEEAVGSGRCRTSRTDRVAHRSMPTQGMAAWWASLSAEERQAQGDAISAVVHGVVMVPST